MLLVPLVSAKQCHAFAVHTLDTLYDFLGPRVFETHSLLPQVDGR